MNEYLLTFAVLCMHQYSNISCFQMVIFEISGRSCGGQNYGMWTSRRQ